MFGEERGARVAEEVKVCEVHGCPTITRSVRVVYGLRGGLKTSPAYGRAAAIYSRTVGIGSTAGASSVMPGRCERRCVPSAIARVMRTWRSTIRRGLRYTTRAAGNAEPVAASNDTS